MKKEDRLTRYTDDGIAIPNIEASENVIFTKITVQLANYEDTGLSPPEIKELQVSDKSKEQSSINYYNETRELRAENAKLTEQLKNAVQLPCKVGDTVYWLYSKGATGWYNDIRVCKVSSISISEHYIEIHSERTSLNDTNFWGRIGDNVFLTKESAEARLEELQGEQQ